MQIQLSTNTRQLRRGYTAGATTSTLAAAPTTTEPAPGSGIVLSARYNLAKLFFTGSADNLTSTAFIYQWSNLGDIWIPNLVCKCTLTCGTAVGVDASDIENEEFFVDTIDFVDGDETVKVTTGIANVIASLTFDLEGVDRWQVSFDDIGGVGESTNGQFYYGMF